jgi:Protein of unknown function (DUF1257)
MSHLATVATTIKDIRALKEAAKALGLELKTGGRVRGYGGTLFEEIDYMIKLPGPFDLGFRKQADGTYAMECDDGLMQGWYGSEAGMAKIGRNAGALKQQYALAILQAEARRKGRQVQTQKMPNGSLRVVMSGGR